MMQILTGEAFQSHGYDTWWCVGPAMPQSWTHIHITIAVFQITSANHAISILTVVQQASEWEIALRPAVAGA